MRKIARLIYENIITALEDLQSFRNKLVLVSGIMCFIALSTKDGVIIGVVFGAWTIILNYYLHTRSKNQNNEQLANGRDER